MEDLRYVARYLRGYRLDMLAATLLIMGETVAELAIPFLMARIVDVGIASGSLSLVLATGRRMVVVALLAGVCGLGYSRFSAKAAMGFGANLREAEYAHLQEYAFANLDEFESSSLVTRLTTDITVIQNAFVMGVRPLLRSPVMLVAGLVLACAMSARLAVVFFVILPFLAVALGLIVHHVAPQYAVLQGVMDRLNETLQEDLVAIRAIKAYVREGHVAKRFEDVNASLADTATHTFGGAVLNMPVFQAAMAVANVGLLWFGGQMVASGEIGVGTLTGFMSYVLLIMNSLNMISSVFLLLARAVTSVGRVCEVLREEPAMDPNPTGAKEVSDGSVELRDVSFKYSAGARRNVLEHVTLRFEPGSTVGILGGTGSGKSSLVQLLPRLYDATEGTVCVGGRDVRDYDVHALRAGVGMVLQKNVLFSGTVRDNLRWGNPKATDQEILQACHVACVDEFLDRIGGLDADLGHGGGNVSGGQKQRLCIARTLLAHPKVMVFDDSTSAVDTATDARIRAGLARLRDVTKVIIAQRVSSVMDADQIVILDDGRVHATGTHAQLLASDPIYQELYYSQNTTGDDGDGAE
ncbi:ABC transporter ATP-binding protein [Parafannyhessea umbonata]|uniref:ABC transporter ATP-binding protein n=1 Tax=Parafannyhessea umbonata TaxID=604330 RepID=A0A6N7XAI8_9ACTN|nr:ABC transporter ATP-binding protein [Parafannyhessea umbonata]MCI7219790.1 ABC transporter ATP-binding protein/permease [Parafannyhessea umbonata]MST60593.1 ABC transporter ATP-binding protein [Parafannyhessea umbonata]